MVQFDHTGGFPSSVLAFETLKLRQKATLKSKLESRWTVIYVHLQSLGARGLLYG